MRVDTRPEAELDEAVSLLLPAWPSSCDTGCELVAGRAGGDWIAYSCEKAVEVHGGRLQRAKGSVAEGRGAFEDHDAKLLWLERAQQIYRPGPHHRPHFALFPIRARERHSPTLPRRGAPALALDGLVHPGHTRPATHFMPALIGCCALVGGRRRHCGLIGCRSRCGSLSLSLSLAVRYTP